jgi:hypothetical protein
MLEGIKAASIAMHTAIIAKSGSGKSFFLGRYLEEVLLKTDATITIFDPNADFRKFKEPEREVWQQHESGVVKNRDWNPCAKNRPPLPHEASIREFSEPWSKVKIRIFGSGSDAAPAGDMEVVRFDWNKLPAHLLLIGDRAANEIEPTDFAVLHGYCIAGDDVWDEFCTGMNDKQRANVQKWTPEQFVAKATTSDDLENAAGHLIGDIEKQISRFASQPTVAKEQEREKRIKHKFIAQFKNAVPVSTETKDHYKRTYRMLERRGRIAKVADPFGLDDKSVRARVFDMPSFRDREDREMSVLLTLDAIWENARDEWERATNNEEVNKSRRPHLIVIDEAHNLIPAESPASPVRAEIRERIKTIAGEGRKYGLFLVIVTQRPDKVDPQVLGECGNQAIMLVPSLTIIQECRDRMGLSISEDEAAMIMNKFGKGYVWLSGTWSPAAPTVTFAAARRTKAGGADLPKGWMTPRKEVAEASAKASAPPTN